MKDLFDVLTGLVASDYYVINPCQLRVERTKEFTFTVSTYNTITDEVDETWELLLDEIKAISKVMASSKLSSVHSSTCWKEALNMAEYLNKCYCK